MEVKMKRYSSLIKTVLIGGMIIVGSVTYAGSDPSQSVSKSKNAIENLKNGIRSDNAGLKRSAIYFAGYYRMNETVPALTEQIRKETDPKTRILIALVLYRIGDEKSISLVRDMAVKDSDTEVRRMCTCIYNAYINGNTEIVIATGNE
jgi:hypothetical protein